MAELLRQHGRKRGVLSSKVWRVAFPPRALSKYCLDFQNRLFCGRNTATMGKHALVYGASGISGWAIVNAILNGYPDKETFTKVSALVNRPLTREMALWPEDPRLQIVSGIDLLKGSQEELEKTIKEKVPDVDSVTQVYFYCKQHGPEIMGRKAIDVLNSIQARRRQRSRMQDQRSNARTCRHRHRIPFLKAFLRCATIRN
jgi:hypothetical protein